MSHFTVAVFSEYEDDVDDLLAPYDENAGRHSPYVEFVESDDPGYEIDQTTGKRGYWTNPNAKWDWYSTGGRWSGLLKLKDGSTADSAKVRDCVLDRDEDEYKRALRFWEVYVDGNNLKPGEKEEDFDSWYKPEYFKDQYGTKEKYAERQAECSTYAFLTREGEWFETGTMCWFGMDDTTADRRDAYAKAFKKYLKQARDEDLLITIVDCHI